MKWPRWFARRMAAPIKIGHKKYSENGIRIAEDKEGGRSLANSVTVFILYVSIFKSTACNPDFGEYILIFIKSVTFSERNFLQ